jgi:hypothetical protein
MDLTSDAILNISLPPLHCAEYAVKMAQLLGNAIYRGKTIKGITAKNQVVSQIKNSGEEGFAELEELANTGIIIPKKSIVLFYNPHISLTKKYRQHAALVFDTRPLMFLHQYMHFHGLVAHQELLELGLDPDLVLTPI